jgi:hypothetical protein
MAKDRLDANAQSPGGPGFPSSGPLSGGMSMLQLTRAPAPTLLGMTTFFLVFIAIGVATIIGAFVYAAFTL